MVWEGPMLKEKFVTWEWRMMKEEVMVWEGLMLEAEVVTGEWSTLEERVMAQCLEGSPGQTRTTRATRTGPGTTSPTGNVAWSSM